LTNINALSFCGLNSINAKIHEPTGRSAISRK